MPRDPEGASGLTEGPVRLTIGGEGLGHVGHPFCVLCRALRAGGSPLCWACISDVLAYDGEPATDETLAEICEDTR